VASELTTYRWPSTDEADRFAAEDPATGEVITIVQGGAAGHWGVAHTGGGLDSGVEGDLLVR
jgi:hypothetical protein